MTATDHHGFILTGATVAAEEGYRRALHAFHCYAGDARGATQAAIDTSPGFVMAHALKCYLHLLSANSEAVATGVLAFAAAKNLPANHRERGHLAAIGALLGGEIRRAGRILEDVAIEHPRDTLALRVGQLCDFMSGEQRMLRDRIGRALPAWSPDMPGYHAVLGMLAYGLQESGCYTRAEAAGREAMVLEPRDNWAQHAVAHVLEMQGRRREGLAWMRGEATGWQAESALAVHNWWHTALFHLGIGESEQTLAIYDDQIFGERSTSVTNLVDAASLLWRLELSGVDVGDRWGRIADAYEAEPRGQYAFDDAHAMMAFVGAGREDAARRLLERQLATLSGPRDNAYFVGAAGLPVMRAFHAYGRADYARTVELLRGVRNQAHRFGGSNAQRDVLDLTLIKAAQRDGQIGLMRALLAEREGAWAAAKCAA